MPTLLQLQKKRDDALSAVASANTSNARSSALAQLEKASMDLASMKQTIASKSKTFVKKEEKYTEEEDDSSSAEEEEEEKDEPKKPLEDDDSSSSDGSSFEDDDSSSSDGSSSDDSSGDAEDEEDMSSSSSSSGSEEEEEEEEEKEEEQAKAAASFLKAKIGVYTPASLLSLAQRVTGKTGVREVFGALDAIGVRLQATGELEARVAKLEGRARKVKVDGLLSQARRDGKITKEQMKSLQAKGMDDPRWLRAHLDTLPKRIRTSEDGPLEGVAFDGGKDGESRRSAHLSAQDLSKDQRFAIEALAQGSGMKLDEFMVAMNERMGRAGKK